MQSRESTYCAGRVGEVTDGDGNGEQRVPKHHRP